MTRLLLSTAIVVALTASASAQFFNPGPKAGANPPCCSRTARSRIDHRYSRKRRRQAASTDIPQIKEGSNRQAQGERAKESWPHGQKESPAPAGLSPSSLALYGRGQPITTTSRAIEIGAYDFPCVGAAGVWSRLIRR